MNIKYSSLKSLLKYSDDFHQENKKFIEDIETRIKEKLTETQVDDYEADLKLLFVQTGGSEGIFLENFERLKPPYYLLTSGNNNSLAASLEIMTYLRLHNLPGEIIHGDLDYLSKRIIELAKIQKIKKELAKTSLGVFGKPSDWLISSLPNAEKLKSKLGISLCHIPLNEVIEKVKNLRLSFDSELDYADRIYQVLVELINSYHLAGLTIRCFDLLTSLKMTGCLALGKLNKEGIIATCEGDIMAMISMILIKLWFNQSSFQANPARIDVAKKEIVLAHCTVPFDMIESYEYDTHFESGIGIALKGKMKKEDVTIFRLSSSLDDYLIMEGRIIENLSEPNLCRTQIKVKLDSDPTILLKEPCGNHHLIFYGHHQKELDSLLKELIKG